MLKLGIRVSTDTSSGRGHFERCLTIRSYITEKVSWFVDDESKFIKNKISKLDELFCENGTNKYTILKKSIRNNYINCVLVDSYHINSRDIYNISNNIPIIVLIDQNIDTRANIIVCPQPIDVDLIEGTKYLCGPKYAPISGKFIFKNKKKYLNNKILISFGAYDSNGITLNVIKAIKNLLLSHSYSFYIVITLGKDSPIINKVRTLIKNLSNFQLVLESKNMEDIYKDCNIAIGAPGLSFLERLASGLPSLLIAQNKTHDELIEKWVKLGCAVRAENSIKSIQNNLNLFFLDDISRKKIIIKGKNLVDGKGGNRIVKEINKLVKYND